MAEIRLLGPVELRWPGDEPVALGPPQQRCVLAALAMAVGRPVAPATLVERVWGQRAPRDVANALHTNVSRLRSALRAVGIRLLRRDGGYLLEAEAHQVDLHHARQLVVDARAAAAQGATGCQEAAELLEIACACWRGIPLTGVKGDWAMRTREALEAERLEVVVQRFEVALRLGRHAAVIAPLAAERLAHPLSEPLTALHMRALCRCGRQAEALEVYARARRQTIDDLGTEPGTALQRLHEQILRRDPALDPAASPDRSRRNRGNGSTGRGPARAGPELEPSPTQVRPAQLPPDLPAFTGREAALAWLDRHLPPDLPPAAAATTVAVIDGMAGIGKTALAVHWGHLARGRFPDGQLFADLRGYSADQPVRPADVLARFLHALGIPAGSVPMAPDAAAAAYRSVTADRRLLVVLDNVATADQVRQLLPASAGCLVLVTSRDRLTGLVARDGAKRMTLGTLAPDESAALLTEMLGAERVGGQVRDAGALADLCGHLPLALRIVGANLAERAGLSLAEAARQLRDRGRLAALEVPGDPATSIRATLDLSYCRLPEPAQRMFRLLGLVPSEDLGPHAAAALAGTGLAAANRLLDELVRGQLLGQPSPGRYHLHDLVREYAHHLGTRMEAHPDIRAALTRLLDFYLHVTVVAATSLEPQIASVLQLAEAGRPDLVAGAATQGTSWIARERDNLRAAIRFAGERGYHAYAWRLARALWRYSYECSYLSDMFAPLQTALAAAQRLSDDSATAMLHNCLAGAYHRAGDIARASRCLEDKAAIQRRQGDQRGLNAVRNNLAMFYRELGRLDESRRLSEQVLAARRHTSGPARLGLTLLNLGITYSRLGRYDEAASCLRCQLMLGREDGASPVDLATTLGELGAVRANLGDHERAIRLLCVAVRVKRRVTEDTDVAAELTYLSAAYRLLGRHQEGRRCIEEALDQATKRTDRPQVCAALNEYGRILLAAGDITGALAQHQAALATAAPLSLRYEQARAIDGIATCVRDTDPHAARQHWERALSLYAEMGVPERHAAARRLDELETVPGRSFGQDSVKIMGN